MLTSVSLPLLWLTSVYALHTSRYNDQHLSPHLWTSLPAITLLQTRAQHAQMHTHDTQWLLFIVHSFTWRASCLAWYNIILQPTLSFPSHSLRDSSATSPQLCLCNTLASFRQKVLLLRAASQPCCVTSRHGTALLQMNITAALYSCEITVCYSRSSGCIVAKAVSKTRVRERVCEDADV